MPLIDQTTRRAAIASASLVAFVCLLTAVLRVAGLVSWEFLRYPVVASALRVADVVETVGWVVLFPVGLVWAIWFVERAALRIENARMQSSFDQTADYEEYGTAGWNPFDPTAAYYQSAKWWLVAGLLGGLLIVESVAVWLAVEPFVTGSTNTPDAFWIAAWALAGVPFGVLLFLLTVQEKLRQSLALLLTYAGLFTLFYILAHYQFGAKRSDGYDLPSGGGSDNIQASAVKVQKVIRKKFVINPYSSIIFSAPPPIEKVDVTLTEETQNRYVVGQGGDGNTGDGDGDGAGFGSGTGKGKAAFVRLKHGDKGWDRNFGIGGDRNMLSEYHARTKQKVADETEYLDAGLLANMPPLKNPPLLYISGSGSLPLSATDKKNLREYITQRHGMILGDNHGGNGFHQHFIAMMNEITGVAPVAIPRDDLIHQRPYALPMLPIVVAHGPPTPLGWKIDGRWAVYYHPGALSDAWRDDHAGIKKDVYESCYQLGVNVMFYSMREKNKWLQSQKP